MNPTRIALPLLAAGLALTAPCHAQPSEVPRNAISSGWLHFFTLEDDEPLHTTVATSPVTEASGIEASFTSPGTGAEVSDGDTLLLAYTRYITPHWAVEISGGLPIDFDIDGKGTIMPNGDPDFPYNLDLGAAQNNPLATAEQWSPTIIAQYHFAEPGARWKPYTGVGFTYTWFEDVELDDDFVSAIQSGLGPALASGFGLSPATTVSADADDAFAFALNAGVSYALTERWDIAASLTWLALETEAEIVVRSADNGQELARSTAEIMINPLVAGLFAVYRF